MNSPPEATIYLLDDDSLVLMRLQQLLESRNYTVIPYQNPVDFLKLDEPRPLSCAFVDFQMPELDGLEVQKMVRKKNWILPLIFISAHGTVSIATEAMKQGGIDFIEKPLNERNVISAAERALSQAEKKHRARCERKDARKKLRTLSRREIEVLEFLMEGSLNKQVAYDLGISERTVKIHRAKILEKLGVESIAQVIPIVMAARLRL
ncbi:MAG: response regulator [Luteolibacter sp.]